MPGLKANTGGGAGPYITKTEGREGPYITNTGGGAGPYITKTEGREGPYITNTGGGGGPYITKTEGGEGSYSCFWLIEWDIRVVSFPGPTQLSIACSTEKRLGRAWE